MADFLLTTKKEQPLPERFKRLYGESNSRDLSDTLRVYGFENTYFYHQQDNGDFIAALGACFYPGKSIEGSLRDILQTFQESSIASLKMELAGQYILIIKKEENLYLFGDNWQVRNIFYSTDKEIISSSFSVLEELLGTGKEKLDEYKVFEYLAIQYTAAYPAWINNGTLHKEIFFLQAFEYIAMDLKKKTTEIKSVEFRVDNRKETDVDSLADRLLDTLKTVIENPGFQRQPVGLTLTGGYDSRLISSIAAPYYERSRFRVGVSEDSRASRKDAAIARRVAGRLGRPLEMLTADKYAKEKFEFYTEGMAPAQNYIITPIIDDTGNYAVGFGGIFGTELFKSRPHFSSVENFIKERMDNAEDFVNAGYQLWDKFDTAVKKQFESIDKHYLLTEPNLDDKIHIFYLLTTGFFGSFMLTPYNIKGLQVEAYGHFKVFDLVAKLPPEFKPPSLLINGGFLQKHAMAKINYPAGKINTTHKRPMVPVSGGTMPVYLMRYLLDKCRIYFNKAKEALQYKSESEEMMEYEGVITDVYHIPNGTEVFLLNRLKRYED